MIPCFVTREEVNRIIQGCPTFRIRYPSHISDVFAGGAKKDVCISTRMDELRSQHQHELPAKFL